MSLEDVLKSVNVFAFTNKLKLVMKGNELELWIASLTTFNFITIQGRFWRCPLNRGFTVLEYPPLPPPGATRVLCLSSGIHSNIQMASCQHLNLPSESLDPGTSVPTHLQSYFDLHHPLELFLLRSALIHTSLYSLYNCLRCLLICG